MKQKVKQIFRNQFLKNVSTLAFGTIISQAIVVGTSPILSRIYSEESFGILSVFTSITVFFAVVSTGRYELALGLPESREKATKIFKLILKIGLFVSVFYFFLIFLLKNILSISDKTGFLSSGMEYFAPLYILLIAVYSACGYWQQRSKNYKQITIANAIQVISATLFSVVFGLLHVETGLIIALIIGILSSNLYLLSKDKTLIRSLLQATELKSVAKEYSSFPRYMIFSDLSLTASQQFIPVLFSILFNSSIVGFYAMANRLIRLPNIVITSAIGNVFRNDAIDEIRINGNCRILYMATFKKLTLMSIPIYIFVFFLSPTLFRLFLGEKWETAGLFARILSVMLMFEFVAVPLSTIFYIRKKQKLLARFQFCNAVIGGIGIYLGSHFFHTPFASLIIFVFSSVIFNILLMVFSYKYSFHD